MQYITDECDWWVNKPLDSLSPKLRDNRLMNFEYADLGGDIFPTARQMEYMWTPRRNIQNHLRPRNVLRQVSDLLIREGNRDFYIAESINWPLDSLEISLRSKMTIVGWSFTRHQEKPNGMFSRHSFRNMTHMSFIDVIFNTKFELKNCPSLVDLSITCWQNVAGLELSIFISKLLPLKSLQGKRRECRANLVSNPRTEPTNYLKDFAGGKDGWDRHAAKGAGSCTCVADGNARGSSCR